MAKSKQGGAFGFLRGKVGGVTYSVLSGEASGTGKKEQIVRSLPESVKNPQTAGQTMQRMKLAPAQKFYSAFSELLSNAFEGISYGDASRRYFMALAMKKEGPYVQKGVDRFLPAAYTFSQGSLPSVGIEPFEGGAAKIILANTVEQGTTTITNAEFAELLGVDEGYQLTVAVVNNVNGVFIPSYISFDNRVTIADLPEGTLSIEDGHVAISPSTLGLDMSAMVACCVVLSVQDASGNWLRSTQEMVISNELRNSLYGPDALEAAIYSYQSGSTVNSVNSAWYYNLGLAQAWGGKLITVVMDMNEDGLLDDKNVVMGIKQIDGRVKRTIFATATTDDGLVVYVENGRVTTNENGTVSQFRGLHMAEYNEVEIWQDSYAAQLNAQPSGETVQEPFTLYVAHYDGTEEEWVLSEEEFVRIENATPDDPTTALVAVTAEGTKRYIISGDTTGRKFGMPLKAKSATEDENAFALSPSYQNEAHKLSNDDTQFIWVSFSESSNMTVEDVENWNTLKGLGFQDSIWLYQ